LAASGSFFSDIFATIKSENIMGTPIKNILGFPPTIVCIPKTIIVKNSNVKEIVVIMPSLLLALSKKLKNNFIGL
jgi:hypothetical protein